MFEYSNYNATKEADTYTFKLSKYEMHFLEKISSQMICFILSMRYKIVFFSTAINSLRQCFVCVTTFQNTLYN